MVIHMEEKNLVFVFDNDNVKDFIKKNNLENNALVICNNYEIKENLSKMKLNCKMLNDYKLSENEIRKSIKWIKSWPDTIIHDNKSLKELLVYNKISIYWYIETRFFLYRIRELLILIESIKQILSKEKPEKIWVKGSDDVRHIISQLKGDCLERFQNSKQLILQREIDHKSYRGHSTFKLFLLKLLRGAYRKSTSSSKDISPILVVTETSSFRKEFDYVSQKFVERDFYFHKIVKKLVESGNEVIVIDFENRPKELLRAFSTNKKRRKSFGTKVVSWETYISMDIIHKSKEFNKKIIKIWNNLKNSPDFVRSLSYDQISIYKLIKDDLNLLLHSFKAYTATTMIDTAKKIIETERPSVILMHDEYGALQMSLINAAKQVGIPTISIQHGIIYEELMPYFHLPEHISGKNAELNFPLPDRMCVWSKKVEEYLLKFGNFPGTIPVVTGDPKLDYLPSVIKNFSYQKITDEMKIPKNKKVILFATENLPNMIEKELVTNTILNEIKNLSDIHLIIKMHPNEDDVSFYRKKIDMLKLSNFSIVKDVNLYETLFISDVVVLTYSTVGYEAMLMGKPVISLNLLGLHDDASLIRKELAFVVKKKEDFLTTIKNCLDPKFIEEHVKNAELFAEQELGKADGKAADRIVKSIFDLKRG